MIDLIIAAGLGLVFSVGGAPIWIPYFKKLKFGQHIREDGPQAHLQKGGTPTFGGIIFFVAWLASVLLMPFDQASVFILIATLGFGLIGFSDDYIKVIKKNNLGLRAWQKMLGLFVVSTGLYLVFIQGQAFTMPFGMAPLTQPVLVYVAFLFLSVAVPNAVNLTDGLDGLCASVTAVISLMLTALAFSQGAYVIATLNMAMFGALMGYLVFNWYPAKVFMGDTGSLALGGYVLANAMVLDLVWWLPLFGLVYVIETLSVMIQVAWFKKTGKRFFKMAPIHHHFELLGWHEVKIVTRAIGVTTTFALITFLLGR